MKIGSIPNRDSLEQILSVLLDTYERPDVLVTVPRLSVWIWHKDGLVLTAQIYEAEDKYQGTYAALYCDDTKFDEIDCLLQSDGIECDIWVHDEKKVLSDVMKIPEVFFYGC
jgi:hypothetical protein